MSEYDIAQGEALKLLRDTMNDEGASKSARARAASEILRIDAPRRPASALDLHGLDDAELLALARGGGPPVDGTQAGGAAAGTLQSSADHVERVGPTPIPSGDMVPRETSRSPLTQRGPKEDPPRKGPPAKNAKTKTPISAPSSNRIAPTAIRLHDPEPWE